MKNNITFCISTYNNLEYLKLAIDSVRKQSYYKNAPFIIHAENCTDGTNEWLLDNKEEYCLNIYLDSNDPPLGIGGGMNFCADRVKTDYIMFLHSDFVVTKNWDKGLMDAAKTLESDGDMDYWVSSFRVEPKMFPSQIDRPGTLVLNKNAFGWDYKTFTTEKFQEWATRFISVNKVDIPKGEGVSGLIRKESWDKIGGNDQLFAPASWEDMDLFLRMQMEGFKFKLTCDSVVWHFGARGSHRLEENDGNTSERQLKAERDNKIKWLNKWGALPSFDEYGMINGLQ